MSASQVQIKKLATLIQQSPFRLLSDDEVVSHARLTEGEFEARSMAFIKDPESGIPMDETSIALTKALLVKMHRPLLSEETVKRYMKLLGLTHTLVERAYGRRRKDLLARMLKDGAVNKGMPKKPR